MRFCVFSLGKRPVSEAKMQKKAGFPSVKKWKGLHFFLDKGREVVTLEPFEQIKQALRPRIRTGGNMAKKAKKATKKAAPKKAATKKAAPKKAAPKKAATKRKPNAAFMKALTPSTALAAVIGATPVPRTEVVKKLWNYIKKHNLQDAKNRRNINADDKLKPIFGKAQVSMFEMTKLVSKHLK